MNGQTNVYAIFVEVKPEAGSELNFAKYDGAFVRCYVPATDEMNATRILYRDLADRRIRLVNVEWCVDHDSAEWENPQDTGQDEAVEIARRSGNIVYGDFQTWGP